MPMAKFANHYKTILLKSWPTRVVILLVFNPPENNLPAEKRYTNEWIAIHLFESGMKTSLRMIALCRKDREYY